MDRVIQLSETELMDLVRRTTLAVVADLRDDLQTAGAREWMDKRQVAEYLGKSAATVERLMATGGLPFSKVNEKAHPMFKRSEVDAWLKERSN